MTIYELIQGFQEAAELHPDGEDAEVLIATQPNYPLQSHIAGVALYDLHEDDDKPDEPVAADAKVQVYIAEGAQVYDEPYAARAVWEAVL